MALILFPPMRLMTAAEVLRDYGAALDAGTHYLLLDGQTLGDRAAVLAAAPALDEPRPVGCVERGKEAFDLNDPFRGCMVATIPEAARAWAAALEDGAALFTFAYRGRLTPDRLRGNTRACVRKRILLAAAYGRPEAEAAATDVSAAARRQTRVICARPRRAPTADWIELLNFSTGGADRFLRACYAVVDRPPPLDTARTGLLVRRGELVRRADGRVDLVTDQAGLRAYRRLSPAEAQSYFEIAAGAGLWLTVRRADGSTVAAAAAEYRGRDDWARVRAREAAGTPGTAAVTSALAAVALGQVCPAT